MPVCTYLSFLRHLLRLCHLFCPLLLQDRPYLEVREAPARTLVNGKDHAHVRACKAMARVTYCTGCQCRVRGERKGRTCSPSSPICPGGPSGPSIPSVPFRPVQIMKESEWTERNNMNFVRFFGICVCITQTWSESKVGLPTQLHFEGQ